MDEQLAKMFRPGTVAPRYGQRPGTVEWYVEGDPRLRLSAGQSLALRPVIRGEPIHSMTDSNASRSTFRVVNLSARS
jgi:hypothetical protein